MQSELRKQLDDALSKIDRPGSFCVAGDRPFVLPGLEVEGMGPIGLPLGQSQAKELLKHCKQAPYGKGTKTLVDTKVRRVWRIGPDRFSLKNPSWEEFIGQTVGLVQTALGLEQQELKSHLYDLLLYGPGDFFLPHRDGEKLDRMVATLIIVLPSAHEGGSLVVRHDGEERTIDFGDSGNPFLIHFAAFYADCEHEVRPLRKGYRLCLVYNLTLTKSRRAIAAPRTSEHVERIVSLIKQWSCEGSSPKLVITLGHQYTKDGLSWDTLKGVDRVKAQVLRDAAGRADCRAYLGLLTYWESGAAEYVGNPRSRGRGWGWDDEYSGGDAADYDMDEVFDSSLKIDHLSAGPGEDLPIGELNVDQVDLLDPESLETGTPEASVEGYTGNEGLTLERWYRHAAIVLWPEDRHFDVICERDSRSVVPVLNRMVAQWRGAGAKDAPALKARCIKLAVAIFENWKENKDATSDVESPLTRDLLGDLAHLDDPELIRRFLSRAVIRDTSINPGESLAAICKKHGWATFQKEFSTIFAATTPETLTRNVELLETICSAKPSKKENLGALQADLASEFVSAIEKADHQFSRASWSWPHINRGPILAGLARALIVADLPELLARAVEYTLASPKLYSLRTVHIPALQLLQPWLKTHAKKPNAALSRWLASCREQLEALTAQEPQEPTDFRRSAKFKQSGDDAAELKRFLEDPRESVHRFRIREDRRNSLISLIRSHKLDVDFKIERTGSPHSLVCTKNQASYKEALKIYHQDLESLATVRSIEASTG